MPKKFMPPKKFPWGHKWIDLIALIST